MADDTFRIVIVMEVEPEIHKREPTFPDDPTPDPVRSASCAKAEGTRVELENTGEAFHFDFTKGVRQGR